MKTRKPAPRQPRLGLETLEARDVPVVIGSLDPTFGTGGKAVVDFGLTPASASAVAIQADGRIVAVGSTGDGNIAVARFRPNGLPDFTFGGGDGKFTFDVGGTDVATSVAIQRDGKIVIGGYTDSGSPGNNNFLAARILADGSGLDTSFGFKGATSIAFDYGGAKDDRAYSLAIQGDGKILLGGYDQFAATDWDFAIVRLNTDGNLDTGFGPLGGGGFYFFDAGPGGLFADKSQALSIQANGQIVLAGSVQVSATGTDIGIVRITQAGTLDPAFGNGGYLQIAFNLAGTDVAQATGLAIQPNGDIVGVGNLQISGTDNYDMFAFRLNWRNGSIDTTFGNDLNQYAGATVIPFDLGGTLNDRATGVKLQPDGKIVISGTVEVSDTQSDFGLVRLNADGTFDTTFDADGKVTIDFGGNDSGNALAIGANGRIVVVGSGGTTPGFALARVAGTVEEPRGLALSGDYNAAAITLKPDYTNKTLVQSGSTVAIDRFGTNVRIATGDVNGDGFPDTIMVTGPGTPIRVAVISGDDNVTFLAGPFDPFDGDFSGGGFVAAGDFDNDGRAEFVVTPDQGGGPRVSVFSLGLDNLPVLRGNFYGINDPNFRGGARAGIGDVNGDGVPDLAVTAGFQGGPRVALYNGRTVFSSRPSALAPDFFAFEQALRNGTYVSIGDVNGDGFGDLIFGAGPGGSARVLTISGQKLLTTGSASAIAAPLSNFFVSGVSSSNRGGVRVATADVDGDNKADVIVSTGERTASAVRVYLGANFGGGEPKIFQDLDPYLSLVLTDGTFVG
ncbi:MAG: FG-GAP-like repeat-containing protein [Gemmataceae bacterium]